MTKDLYKHPRLYLNAAFEENALILLETDQSHYLRNVLRKKTGDHLRVFNGRNGEYLAVITEQKKKETSITLVEKLKDQPKKAPELALYFSPIKTARLSVMVEKAVELGVSDFYPVITKHTEKRFLNDNRIQRQMIEAAEQCERLDIPHFHESQDFDSVIKNLDKLVIVGLEREELPPLRDVTATKGPLAFFIGPEGGFSDAEIKVIVDNKYLVPVSLGDNILRAETAAIACLSWARLSF